MGSVMEAVLYRVPMVVVPCFGDQTWNADCIDRAKLGVSFRYPLRTLTVDALRDAVLKISVKQADNNIYQQSLQKAAASMEHNGGADKAADLAIGVFHSSWGSGELAN